MSQVDAELGGAELVRFGPFLGDLGRHGTDLVDHIGVAAVFTRPINHRCLDCPVVAASCVVCGARLLTLAARAAFAAGTTH